MTRRTESISSYEAEATGRLSLELAGGTRSGRVRRWADRRDWTVEDKLGEVLWEVEMRSIEARDARQAEERRQAAAEQAWHEAMARARLDYFEQRRADVLLDQVTRWRRAQDIRAYCEALRSASSADGSAEWVAWAMTFADTIDPLPKCSGFPAITEPRPEDLRPHLNGLNPYGPETRW